MPSPRRPKPLQTLLTDAEVRLAAAVLLLIFIGWGVRAWRNAVRIEHFQKAASSTNAAQPRTR
jgi:hypothetical protein